MFLHPPIGACAFKTNTVSLLSGRVSCQWDWFPRKEVSVSWLLFNKCTVSIIQAFEQIPFAYRKNPELFSLLSKINQVLEFITDSQTVVQSNPKVGCFDCLVWSLFFFFFSSSQAQMSGVAEPVWLLCEFWRGTNCHLELLPRAATTTPD